MQPYTRLTVCISHVPAVLVFQVLGVLSARYPSAPNLTSKLESSVGGVTESDTEEKVLLLDLHGPSRSTGDGVRVMGMLVDLQKCSGNRKVHVLSDHYDYKPVMQEWDEQVRNKVFPGVKLWTPEDWRNGRMKLDDYKRIIIGAKLDLLHMEGGIVNAITEHFSKTPSYWKDRVSVFWDDVPFVRCQYKTDPEEWCPHVSEFVQTRLAFAHNFFVLTLEDQDRFQLELKNRNMQDINIRVWPMRIENMARLLPRERYNSEHLTDKHIILMIGNHHPVNTKNLKLLFSGSVAQICNEIERTKSDIKIMFIGEMAFEVKRLVEVRQDKYNMKCVKYITGFVAQEKLEKEILPVTRAFLNPFLFNVSSGISVKTYEAIMQGFPLITSSFGMHGLRNVHDCQRFVLPKDPTSVTDLTQFILTNIIDHDGYRAFSRNFQTVSKKCQDGQMMRYPVDPICD